MAAVRVSVKLRPHLPRSLPSLWPCWPARSLTLRLLSWALHPHAALLPVSSWLLHLKLAQGRIPRPALPTSSCTFLAFTHPPPFLTGCSPYTAVGSTLSCTFIACYLSLHCSVSSKRVGLVLCLEQCVEQNRCSLIVKRIIDGEGATQSQLLRRPCCSHRPTWRVL